MSWLRFSDDWNRRPEIRALDDADYRALCCLIEAAENFGHNGVVTDDYAMVTYPHPDRRKLRHRIRKLVGKGLVHELDDTPHYCPACEVRAEAMGVGTHVGARKVREKLSGLASTRGKTASMLICICGFFYHSLPPDQKEREKQKARERQQRKRQRDRLETSRRDADHVSRSPVPVPVPVPDPDVVISKESLANLVGVEQPSPSSDAAPETPAGVELQQEIDARRKTLGYKKPIRWTGKHLEALQELEALAVKQPDLLEHALDGFFADEGQRGFEHLPRGLVMHWDRYTDGPKKRRDAQQRQLRSAQRDLLYYQDLAQEGGRPIPMSLAELEPRYLEKMQGEYPGLDLSQVRSRRRAVATKVEPKQRGGEPGNAADYPEFANYLAQSRDLIRP